MDGTLRDGIVVVGGDGRQRFHDSRAYGRPREAAPDSVALAPVEAAHLLYRGDLDAVVDADGAVGEAGERLGFRPLLSGFDLGLRFVVYRDLRDRGFYLSPARSGWVDDPDGCDLIVYPRGKGPWDDAVAHRIRVVGERRPVRAADAAGTTLAVVDEDGELTYFEASTATVSGTASDDLPAATAATLLSDRVAVWEPPAGLYEAGFYGQRLGGRDADSGPLVLSLVEAAHLASEGVLALDAERVRERGRETEGERFDRRLAVYRRLRAAGAVPKSGFKFGADFRTYESFDSLAALDHSETLIRVVDADHAFLPRDLSLDVRLAGGVRKRMVFALVDDAEAAVDWLSVDRLTP